MLNQVKTLPLLLFALALTMLPYTNTAWADDDLSSIRSEVQKLQQQVQEQQQTINELRNQKGKDWSKSQEAEDVRLLVSEMMKDAQTRVDAIDTRILAGHDGSFYVRSADGNFLLRVKGLLQIRYTANLRDDPVAAGADDGDNFRSGFGLARTRFAFTGHVFDPSWEYMLWAGYNRMGSATLLDAYIRKSIGDTGLSITVGQFKTPFLKEYLVSETALQFVDRSLVSGSMSDTYTQGIMLTYTTSHVRLFASINDGKSSLNSDWDVADTDLGATARIEFRLFGGDWKQYAVHESFRGSDKMLVIGAAAHYQLDESGFASDEINELHWTVDGTLHLGGANIFLALVGETMDGNNTPNRQQLGAVAQSGFFVTEQLELIGRFEWGESDVAGEHDLMVVTLGTNYFIKGHKLKVTADVGYAINPVSATWSSTGLGWRTDAPGQDGQIVGRVQIHLLY